VTQIGDTVMAALDSNLFIVQLVLGPVAMNEGLLAMRDTSSRLPFALPPPSYLKFGAFSFAPDEIATTQSLVTVEHDKGFCRIDGLTSLA